MVVGRSPRLPGLRGNRGDKRGGPSIRVGGDRKARVSEAGRASGLGPNGDLSPMGTRQKHGYEAQRSTLKGRKCEKPQWLWTRSPLKEDLPGASRANGSFSTISSLNCRSVSLYGEMEQVSAHAECSQQIM